MGVSGPRMWRRRVSHVAAAIVAVSVGVATVGPAVAVAAPLTLTGMSPTSGTRGTLVTLTGTGLTNADQVSFNGAVKTGTANAAQTKLVVVVPANATSGVVTVTDPATGARVSLPNSPFQVIPTIFPSPSHAWAGGTLTVIGTGLSPDSREPIYIGSKLIATAITDGRGYFRMDVSVPWDVQAGKLSIYLIDPHYSTIISVLFVIGAWPQFRHDETHLAIDTYEPSLLTSNVSKLTDKWNVGTYGPITSSPAVADGTVYVGSQDGSLYAWNAGNGKLRWSYPTGGAVNSSPAVANGRVFVLSSGGVFYALNSATGALLWKRSIGADSDSSPVAGPSDVYVGTNHDGDLYAFDQATGSMLWNFPTSGALDSPAVSGGRVYVGSQNGNVYAVNASTGTQVWKRNTGEILESSPDVSGGQVYIGNSNGTLYSLDATTGAVTWSWSSLNGSPADGSAMRCSPVVNAGVAYICSDYGRLYAVDTATRKLKWEVAPGAYQIEGSPALANDVLYLAGGITWNFLALNATTGKTLYTTNVGSSTDSSPAVSNGLVYFGSYDGYLHAFGL